MQYSDRKTVWGIILSSVMLLMVFSIALLNTGSNAKPKHETQRKQIAKSVSNSIPSAMTNTASANAIKPIKGEDLSALDAAKVSSTVIAKIPDSEKTSDEKLAALLDEALKEPASAPSKPTNNAKSIGEMSMEELDAELERLENEENKFDIPAAHIQTPKEPKAIPVNKVAAQEKKIETEVSPSEVEAPEPSINTPITNSSDDQKAISRLQGMSFKQLTFKFGELKLSDKAVVLVREVAQELNSYNNVKVKVNNYTDSYGNDDFNLNLSKRRARVIYNAFLAEGVDEKKISYEGHGEANPIATNSNLVGRRKNRRTELEFSLGN